MALTVIKILGFYSDDQNNLAVGSVTFRASGVMEDTSDGQIAEPELITGTLVSGVLTFDGSPWVPLYATDDPTTLPLATVTYLVTEQIQGALWRQYSIPVPHDSPGGQITLGMVPPAPPPDWQPNLFP